MRALVIVLLLTIPAFASADITPEENVSEMRSDLVHCYRTNRDLLRMIEALTDDAEALERRGDVLAIMLGQQPNWKAPNLQYHCVLAEHGLMEPPEYCE